MIVAEVTNDALRVKKQDSSAWLKYCLKHHTTTAVGTNKDVALLMHEAALLLEWKEAS